MSTPPIAGTCQAIRRLVEVCRAGQTGYAMAGKAAGDAVLRAELLQYSGQREEFVAELHDALRGAGDDPHDTSHLDPSGSFPEWGGLSEAIAKKDRTAILARCEESDAAAAEEYRSALSGGLAAPLRALVHAQFVAISRVRDRLQSLLEAGGRK